MHRGHRYNVIGVIALSIHACSLVHVTYRVAEIRKVKWNAVDTITLTTSFQEGNVAFSVMPNPFLLNKIWSNQ